MTNILAFKFGEYSEGKRYIIGETDSQATFTLEAQKEENVQKLFRIGNSFVMYTGSRVGGQQIIYGLLDSQPTRTIGVVEKIITLIERRRLPEKDIPKFIVCGFDSKAGEIYHVNPTGEDFREYASVPYAFDGTGSQESRRAFERDLEKFFSSSNDISEALLNCFDVSLKAIKDLYSNDKRQLGLITKEGGVLLIRTLYDPEVHLETHIRPNLLDTYLKTNLPSVKLPDSSKNLKNYLRTYRTAKMLLDALFELIIEKTKRLYEVDIRCNIPYTRWKVEDGNESQNMREMEENRAKRIRQKQKLNELVEAWYSGDPTSIVSTIQTSYENRIKRFQELIV